MPLPELFLGNQMVVGDSTVAFNDASVTVKAPVSDLNATNKLYVDSATSALSTSLANETSNRISEDAALSSSLATETSNRIREDAALSTSIANETSNRISEDAALSTSIANETSNRISEDAEIIASSCRSMIVPLTTAIVGGQAFPTVMSSSISELGYDGWYYNKTLNDTVNRKINWYFAPDVNMTVADLYQMFFEIKLIKPNKIPFVAVYTKPTGSGDAASWFKSSRTFEVLNTTLNADTNYCCYYNFNNKAVTPVSYAHTLQSMSLTDVVANIRGPFESTEQVLAFAFSTDSSAGVGTVELICRSFSVQSSKGTVNFLLSNVHVENKALSTQVNNMYQYFFKQDRDGPAIV